MLKKAIDSMLYLLRVDERKLDNDNLNSNEWPAATSCHCKKENHLIESSNPGNSEFTPSFIMATSFHSAPLPQQSSDHIQPVTREDRNFANHSNPSNNSRVGHLETNKNSTSHGKLGHSRAKSSRKRNPYKHERLMDQNDNGEQQPGKSDWPKEENLYCDMIEWGTDVTYLALSEKLSSVDKMDSKNLSNRFNNHPISVRQTQVPNPIPPPPFSRMRRRSRPMSMINSHSDHPANVDLIDLNDSNKSRENLNSNRMFSIPAAIITGPLDYNLVNSASSAGALDQTRSASSTPTLIRGKGSTFTMAHLKNSLDSITQVPDNESPPKRNNMDSQCQNQPPLNSVNQNLSDLPNSISNLKVSKSMGLKVRKSKSSTKTCGHTSKLPRSVHYTNKDAPLSPECRHWSFTFYDFDEKKPTQDSRALVHSVFAVVSASLRQHYGSRKQTGKKRNRFTGYQCRHEKSNFYPSSHQHLVLENLPNVDSGTKDKLWHLCIKWNPQDSKEDPSAIGGSVTKTRIIATLGAQNNDYPEQINQVSNDFGNCFIKRPRLNKTVDLKCATNCDLDTAVCCQCHASVKLGSCYQARPNSCADMLKSSWVQSSLNDANVNDLTPVSDSELEERVKVDTDGHIVRRKQLDSNNHMWCRSKWTYLPHSNTFQPMDHFSDYCANCYICKQANHFYFPSHWCLPNNTIKNPFNHWCLNDNINTLCPLINTSIRSHQKCCPSSFEHPNVPCTRLYPNPHNYSLNGNSVGDEMNFDFDHKKRRSQSIQHPRKRTKFPSNYQPKSRSKSQPQTERDVHKFIPNSSSHCHHFYECQVQPNVQILHDPISNSIQMSCPTTSFCNSKPKMTALHRRKSEIGWTNCMGHEHLIPKTRICSKTRIEAQDRRDRHQDRKNLGQQQVKEWLGNTAQQNHFSRPTCKHPNL